MYLCGRLFEEVGGLLADGLREGEQVLYLLAVLQLSDLEPVVLSVQPQHLLPLLEQKHLQRTRTPGNIQDTHFYL